MRARKRNCNVDVIQVTDTNIKEVKKFIETLLGCTYEDDEIKTIGPGIYEILFSGDTYLLKTGDWILDELDLNQSSEEASIYVPLILRDEDDMSTALG